MLNIYTYITSALQLKPSAEKLQQAFYWVVFGFSVECVIHIDSMSRLSNSRNNHKAQTTSAVWSFLLTPNVRFEVGLVNVPVL